MREHVFVSTGRVFHHGIPGKRLFTLSESERDVYLDYAGGGGYGCKVTVPVEELRWFTAGRSFRLVPMDFQSVERPEDI